MESHLGSVQCLERLQEGTPNPVFEGSKQAPMFPSDPFLSQEPHFDELRQGHVAQHREGQERPVQRRQRREAEIVRHQRERDGDANHHDAGRHHQERPRGVALEERDFIRANDMDDERLGKQALHEPTGLK